MEDKLKAFLQEIQGKVSEAIAMCGGEEEQEMQEESSEGESMQDMGEDSTEKDLRKEKLKMKFRKEFSA